MWLKLRKPKEEKERKSDLNKQQTYTLKRSFNKFYLYTNI